MSLLCGIRNLISKYCFQLNQAEASIDRASGTIQKMIRQYVSQVLHSLFLRAAHSQLFVECTSSASLLPESYWSSLSSLFSFSTSSYFTIVINRKRLFSAFLLTIYSIDLFILSPSYHISWDITIMNILLRLYLYASHAFIHITRTASSP